MSVGRRIALLCLLAAAPAGPAAAQADPFIAQAERSAAAGGPAAANDLAALFDALRASRDPLRQIPLIDAAGRLGDPAGPSAADIRAAVRAAAPPLLVDIVRSDADWSVRGEAMTVLRQLDAAHEPAQQAIAAADADTGEHAGYLHGTAAALRTWLDSRANAHAVPPASTADAQRRARLLLRQNGISVTYDALSDAIGQGRAEIVATLLSAGLQVGGEQTERAAMAVLNGLTSACSLGPVPSEQIGRALTLVTAGGLPPNRADENGNTLLMSAAQFCPAPVAAALLDLGAAPDPVNKQRFTPLQMALVSGKWDVVGVLVDHGARITAAQSSQIFFEAPQAPAQRELLARATR